MSIASVFHKVIDGIHHLFTAGVQAVEQVKVYIDARPGLKADLDKLFGPIKDGVQAAFSEKLAELENATPDEALSLLKADIPDILNTVKQGFVEQAHHAGNVDVMLHLAASAVLAAIGTPAATTRAAATETATPAPLPPSPSQPDRVPAD